MRHIPLSFMLFQFGLLISPIAEAEGYQLGQGWQSGSYSFSGYANIEVIDRFDAPSRIDLDDLSLFASGHANQWFNPFAEVELSKQTLIRQGGGAVNGDVIVERFYNDVILSERDTLRLGKMLAPLGNWNSVHAAPLIPIITRPYTTRGFSTYASGVSWKDESEDGTAPDFQLYWQPDNEFFKRPASQTTRNFHNVLGGQISKTSGVQNKVGASFQHAQLLESGEMYTLAGVNTNQSFGKVRLEGEAVTAHFSGTVLPSASPRLHARETGIFILADYAITPQWHGVVEGEYYQDHTMSQSSRSVLFAVNYKPAGVPLVWKLEYIHQAGVASPIATIRTGLKGSLSFLF